MKREKGEMNIWGWRKNKLIWNETKWSFVDGITQKELAFARSKFKNGLFPRTICPRRLSFSQFVVLMRTTSCEKDSLLGQLVLGKKQLTNFERVTFFCTPFTSIIRIYVINIVLDQLTLLSLQPRK